MNGSFRINLRTHWGGWILILAPFAVLMPASPLLQGFILFSAFGMILAPVLVALQKTIDRMLDSAPGLRRAQGLLRRLLALLPGHRHEVATLDVSVTGATILVATLCVVVLAALSAAGLPVLFGTVSGWAHDLNELSKTLPSGEGFINEVYEKSRLGSLGVTREMVNQAIEHVREHLGSFIAEPAKALALSLPKLVMFGGKVILGVPLAILVTIGFGWMLAVDTIGVQRFLRKFLPNQAEDLIELGTVFQRDGRLLFRAMGLVMLICTVIFTLTLHYGYGMPWFKSIGNGTALGVTGGVMVIGGFVNYLIGIVIGSASFGFTMMFVYFMATIWFVHHLETGFFTPWAMGNSLGVRYLGVIMCLLAGTLIKGPHLSAIIVGMLLIPYYKGVWAIVGEPKPAASAASPTAG